MLISRKTSPGFPTLSQSEVSIPSTTLSAAVIWMATRNHVPVADKFGVHDHHHRSAPPPTSGRRPLDQYVRTGVLGFAIVERDAQQIDRQLEDLLSTNGVATADGSVQVTTSHGDRMTGAVPERSGDCRIIGEIPKIVGSVDRGSPRLTLLDGHAGSVCGAVGAALSDTTPRNAASAA